MIYLLIKPLVWLNIQGAVKIRNMDYKKCFRCGRTLPMDDFYKHQRMGDGHLNKCKECTKADSRERYAIKSTDKEWVGKERQRNREKFRRLNYKGRFLQVRSICHENANISKRLRSKGIDTTGKEAHHWNYNLPYSVFLLSRKAHRRIHLHLKVNYEDKFCYTDNGERLDTEDKAKMYFSKILKGYGMSENLDVFYIRF